MVNIDDMQPRLTGRLMVGSLQRNGSLRVEEGDEIVTYNPAKFVVNNLDTAERDEESSEGGMLTCNASNFVDSVDESNGETSNTPAGIQVIDLEANYQIDEVDPKESLSTDEDVPACNVAECKVNGMSLFAAPVLFFFGAQNDEKRSTTNNTRDIVDAERELPPPRNGDVLDYVCEGVEGLVCTEGAETGEIVQNNSMVDRGIDENTQAAKVNASAGQDDKDRLDQMFETMEGYACNHDNNISNDKDALDHVFENLEGYACNKGSGRFTCQGQDDTIPDGQNQHCLPAVCRNNSLLTDSSASGSETSVRERISKNGKLVDVEHGGDTCEMNIVGRVRDASLLSEDDKVVPFHQSRCFLCLLFNSVLTTGGVVGIAVWWFLTS